ncbi:uncharacterized protein PFLUO_LOCUS6107 [Penicillium psychrofluorescens]|uniref:uncharacterized protein n=1 Tax=Penicillium psychrofluorescens TaxID=3158075 RepID=UPI003CCCBFE0
MSSANNLSPVAPVANPTIPFWRKEPHELDNIRTTPELPEQSDIVIIGGGYAGVSIAYHLVTSQQSESQPPPSITLLEARQICSGATGRNGGHLRPDVYETVALCLERHGIEAAIELARFEVSHIPAVKAAIAKEKIDCDFNLTRCMNVYLNEEHAERARQAYEVLRDQGASYVDDIHYTSQKNAEGVSGVQDAKACLSYTAGNLWAYKLVMGLLSRVVKSSSVNVQTMTPVTSVTSDSPHHLVQTPRGTIRASKVVYATNAYTAGLLPEYSKNIVPCKGICCHITTPENKTPPFLPYTYVVWNKEGDGDSYLISRPDGSIIVGGAQYSYAQQKDIWHNNVDDSTLIEPAKHYYDTYMQRTFRGWEDSEVKVQEIWSGIMGYSYDTHPQVGEVPGKPGQFICAGFNGHGMPVVFLSGKGIAEMIRDSKKFEEVGLPRIYKTTLARLEAAQTGPEGGDTFDL